MNRLTSLSRKMHILGIFIAGCAALSTTGNANDSELAKNLTGIWLLEQTTRADYELTEHATSLMADYDILNDDPSLECDPASWSRIYSSPNLVIQIGFDEDQVRLGYDLFDIRRLVAITDLSKTPSSKSAHKLGGDPFFDRLGSSVAQVTGEELIISTTNYKEGYVLTGIGLPQTTQASTTERFWLSDEKLHVELSYSDPTVFKGGFSSVHQFVRRADEESLNLYDCTSSNYDWFNELNSDKSESW